jgi:hypothetical protein
MLVFAMFGLQIESDYLQCSSDYCYMELTVFGWAHEAHLRAKENHTQQSA